MVRKLRLEYPGAIYHLMNRGDRREPIFRDDRNRVLFLGDRRKGDPRKLEPPRRMRAEITMNTKICDYTRLTPLCPPYS